MSNRAARNSGSGEYYGRLNARVEALLTDLLAGARKTKSHRASGRDRARCTEGIPN